MSKSSFCQSRDLTMGMSAVSEKLVNSVLSAQKISTTWLFNLENATMLDELETGFPVSVMEELDE